MSIHFEHHHFLSSIIWVIRSLALEAIRACGSQVGGYRHAERETVDRQKVKERIKTNNT